MRINLILILFISVMFFACKEETETNQDGSNIGHKIEVEEVVQANAYTYLRVTENDNEYWMAITKQNIEEGAVLYYTDALEMKNFESRDLARTFETIYFVQNISTKPITADAAGMDQEMGQKPTLVKQNISVEPVSGGITISELYGNREKYENKIVKIRGQVTKYNAGIMDRNWIHMQDGTSSGEYFDLTITTKDEVKVGDIVVFEGEITLNKDFGAGYSYEVIMEESKLVK
ncbi:MAG: hypothetical protein F9K45_06145 [Melioribacteraceae bacterium]|nr:MAG: hypothetical protein F9K45_06145 [Melioribacteraceae bacterium]